MLAQRLMAADASPISVTFVGTTQSTSNLTTYTFNGVSIGGPGLIVVVAHGSADTGLTRTLASLTVNGTGATIHSNTSSQDWAFTTSSRVASGATANIVVTYSGAALRCVIAVYRIQNNASDTPVQALTNYSSTAVTSRTLTFNAAGDGVGVFGATSGSAASFTWTNATEQFDTQVEGNSTASGATRGLGLIASTVTATCAASNRLYLSGAFWR